MAIFENLAIENPRLFEFFMLAFELFKPLVLLDFAWLANLAHLYILFITALGILIIVV